MPTSLQKHINTKRNFHSIFLEWIYELIFDFDKLLICFNFYLNIKIFILFWSTNSKKNE